MKWKVRQDDYYILDADSHEAAIAIHDGELHVFVGLTDGDSWDFTSSASSLQEAKEMAVVELLRQLHMYHRELSDRLAANNVLIEQVQRFAIETRMGL